MEKSGVSRWLPIIIPVAVIVILLPVAIVIGMNTGEDNESSNPASTVAAASEVTAVAGAVQVTNFAFVPEKLTVTPGGQLTFQNTSNTEHRIQVGDGEAKILPQANPGSGTLLRQEHSTFSARYTRMT